MAAKLLLVCCLFSLFLCFVYTRKSIPYHKFTCKNDSLSCTISAGSPKLRPGNRCLTASNCYSQANFCENGYCRGLPLKSQCKNSLECDIGLMCINNICVNTQQKDQYCDREILCASYLICIDNRCVQYGSMETGSVITSEISQQDFAHFACKSGYAIASGGDLICSDGYKRTTDMICTNDQQFCLYDNANGQLLYNISCVCGCSMFQMGYCPPGTGDDEYVENFREMVEFSFKKRPCHVYYNRTDKTDIPLYCDLARNDNEGYDAYLAYLELDNQTFARIQDNNQSVRDKENEFYWRYNEGDFYSHNMAILFIVFMFSIF